MAIHKISLMDAYMIETLRSNGISNQELIAGIEQGNVEAWKDLNDKFDFNELVKLFVQDAEAFQTILLDGYKVKFLTFKGLQNLLRLRFEKEKEIDYQLTETGIQHLRLDNQQLLTLKQMLSGNWLVEEKVNENGAVVNVNSKEASYSEL